MKLQTELFKPRLFKLIVNDVERRHFFGNEQYLFAVGKALRDNVCNSLALTRTRWALQNKALTAMGKRDCIGLAGVSVNNVEQLNRLIPAGFSGGLLTFYASCRLAKKCAYVWVLHDFGRVVP